MLLYALLWTGLLGWLAAAAWIDVRTQTIPWWLVLSGSALGIGLHSAGQGWIGAAGATGGLAALAGCLLWFAGAELFWRVAPIGGGDLNLLALTAAYTGWQGPVLVLLLAGLVQTVVYVVAWARGDMRLARPFAPALLAGAVLLFVWQLASGV